MRSVGWTGGLIAIALAVVGVGAYVLRHVDGWTDPLAAIATVGATLAALFIATRDRTERKSEQLHADRAQARLVVLSVQRLAASRWHFPLIVANHGAQPLLDVVLDSAEYFDGERRLTLFAPGDEMRVTSIVPVYPHRETLGIPYSDQKAIEAKLFPMDGDKPVIATGEDQIKAMHVTAAVRFTDANGNQWRRSTTGLVELIKRG